MTNLKHNYKLTIAYKGTRYAGWQIQPNALSIQEVIEAALKTFLKEEVRLIASGRTDAGVHALGQIAHFKAAQEIDCFRLLRAMSGLLPADIRVMRMEEVCLDFHAQYNAVGKTYHYHLYTERVLSPFRRDSWHLRMPCDIKLLQQASIHFVGTHDFSSFCNEADRGSAARDPVRSLKRLDVVPVDGGVRLEFEADGFLYKMVRNIVGTLVAVATGQIDLRLIPLILAGKDRRLAAMAAPPQGLFLMQVEY